MSPARTSSRNSRLNCIARTLSAEFETVNQARREHEPGRRRVRNDGQSLPVRRAGATGEVRVKRRAVVLWAGLASLALPVGAAQAQTPTMTDARLDVRSAVQGLTGPTNIAFLGQIGRAHV